MGRCMVGRCDQEVEKVKKNHFILTSLWAPSWSMGLLGPNPARIGADQKLRARIQHIQLPLFPFIPPPTCLLVPPPKNPVTHMATSTHPHMVIPTDNLLEVVELLKCMLLAFCNSSLIAHKYPTTRKSTGSTRQP